MSTSRSISAGLGRALLALWALVVVAVPARAQVAPVLRHQVDQQGDVLLIGNTLGQDCANGTPAPVVGTVGDCGSSVSDSAPDVFWRADEPGAGQATASTAIGVADARSTAVLELPAGAVVTYARLYWAAMTSSGSADSGVSLDRPGVFAMTLPSDVGHEVVAGSDLIYESSAEVTALVQEHGSGAYRVSDVDSIALADVASSRAFAVWSMVVFYELATEPLRQLTLFDGLALAGSGTGVVVNVSGFLVPNAGIDAKLGVVAYGSDGQTGGDTLSFNGANVSDGLGGTNNFFNGSKTWLGSARSVAGDLPQLTGGERSMAGADLDVVSVTALVAPASTSANISAKAGGDNNVLLGALITSITTFKPNFDQTVKSVTDLNGGLILPGDVLRYTVDVINTGNDPALDVVLEDVVPAGLAFVPGSIDVVDGFNDGIKTDAAGDDQAEYDALTRTVRVRLGSGASSAVGGSMAIDATATVIFDVTVGPSLLGLVQNQVTITASGENGSPEEIFTSTDGQGSDTTDAIIHECAGPNDCPVSLPQCLVASDPGLPNLCVACLTNAHCSGTTPVCRQSDHSCVACGSDADCPLTASPACQLTGPLAGACAECSADNDDRCGGAKPECLVSLGICGCSDVDGDSECGEDDSGVICNGPSGICVPGCSTADGRNGCPAGQICTETSGAVGVCIDDQECFSDTDCQEPLGVCDTAPVENVCVQCLDDDDCDDPFVCDETVTKTCVECTTDDATACSADGKGSACLGDQTCGCVDDSDCGAADSGRVCDPATRTCTVGCRGSGGNGCPSTTVCTSITDAIGRCVACVSDDQCGGGRPRCDVPANVCVECLGADDCGNQRPVCSAGVCVGCTNDAQCPDETRPACQLTGARAGSCTECSSSNLSRCDPDRPICLSTALCGCTDTDGDSECGASDSGRVCSGAAGSCVDGCSKAESRNDCPADQVCSHQSGAVGDCLDHCNTDNDCVVAPLLVCDTRDILHVCVECFADVHCSSQEVCDLGVRACVGCIDDDDCATGDVCNPTAQACVDCMDDGDCETGDLCDTGAQTCVDCMDDGDCETGSVCETTSHDCVQCVDDGDCETGTVCDGAEHICVDCVEDGDCETGSVCDVPERTCVECVEDGDCETGSVCDTATRECVGCLDDADCGALEVCEATVRQCVGCVDDDDCESGSVCDVSEHECVGCVEDADCEQEQRCATSAGECVTCVEAGDCSDQTTCDVPSGMCVGCTENADCEDDEVCDEPSQTCVECTEQDSDACSADDAGALCLDDNTCGCVVDEDCGDGDSGRVCDADRDRCVEGCRGEDGNGCASGMRCSSDDDDIGTCEPDETEPEPEPPLEGVIEGGGCDCSIPASGDNGRAWPSLAALALVALRLRRRRRGR